jgi:hypothetical protein
MGDWHSGAKIESEERGPSSEQDGATTRRQVALLWASIERLLELPPAGLSYRKLHIIALGDLIETKDLRPTPDRRGDELISVQTIQVFELFTWLCRQALTIFPRVEVELVGGSHDRVTGNGDAALRELADAEAVSFLIGEFARRQFANEPRISVRTWPTCFGSKQVAERRVVFARGGSSTWNENGYGRLPWYQAPLLPRTYAEMLARPRSRSSAREIARRSCQRAAAGSGSTGRLRRPARTSRRASRASSGRRSGSSPFTSSTD